MKNPTYANMGDHTETVQVDFDPQRITYSELLAIFWKSHTPGSPPWSRQYMNAVFYHNEQQRRQAMASKAAVEEQTGASVHSEIAPVGEFYPAEDYHQKYLLKMRPDLTGELQRMYPRAKEFNDSTAAARINGYVGGYGTSAQLIREIDSLGLSPQSRTSLTETVRARESVN
jgi:peptide-methionine (S)-S-oxide reductase